MHNPDNVLTVGAADSADRGEAGETPAVINYEIRQHSLILRRPQYRLVGNDIHFLISRRPFVRLSDFESQVWAAIGEQTTLEDVQGRFPCRVEPTIHHFVDLGLCDIAESRFPSVRRRVLVIEPHSDDAVLSVGGTMWLRRHTCEFTIATIGSRSNFTSYYFLDRDFHNVEEVSELRAEEGEAVARLLGGRYVRLGEAEATARYRDVEISRDWFRKHHLAVRTSTGRCYGKPEFQSWTSALRKLIRDTDADEIWIPLGVGTHCDHQLARDACLSVLSEHSAVRPGCSIMLYQEVPYAARSPAYTTSLVTSLTQAGAVLIPLQNSVKSVFEQKLRLISVYGSQFKLDVLRPEIEASARLAAGGQGLCELLWRVEELPTRLNPISLYIDRLIVERKSAQCSRWARRYRDAERIRVLLLVPAGRWTDDAKILLRTFPQARFDVYVSLDAAGEVMAYGSSRIRVHCVGAGSKGWLTLVLKLAVSRRTPTLFIAGRRRRRQARILATAWPLCDPLVLASMDHFLLSLSRRNDSEDGLKTREHSYCHSQFPNR